MQHHGGAGNFLNRFCTSHCLMARGKHVPFTFAVGDSSQGQQCFVEVTQLDQFTSLWGVPGASWCIRREEVSPLHSCDCAPGLWAFQREGPACRWLAWQGTALLVLAPGSFLLFSLNHHSLRFQNGWYPTKYHCWPPALSPHRTHRP